MGCWSTSFDDFWESKWVNKYYERIVKCEENTLLLRQKPTALTLATKFLSFKTDLREILVAVNSQIKIELDFNFGILCSAADDFSRNNFTRDRNNSSVRSVHEHGTDDFTVGNFNRTSIRNLNTRKKSLLLFQIIIFSSTLNMKYNMSSYRHIKTFPNEIIDIVSG